MDLNEVLEVFYMESNELLESIESLLLNLEKEPKNLDSLNALFRAIHTIKGTSGMFGFNEIVKFTHVVENLLDNLREGKIEFKDSISDLLLKSKDYINYLISTEPKGNGIPKEQLQYGESLLSQIAPIVGLEITSKIEISNSNDSTSKPNQGSNAFFLISLRPNKDCLEHGLDPLSFLTYLKKIGKIINLKTLIPDLSLETFNPEIHFLGYEILFETDSEVDGIRKVFEFLESDALISILPPRSSISNFVKLAKSLPEESIFMGNLWKDMGIFEDKELVLYLQELKGSNSGTQIPETLSHSEFFNKALPTKEFKNETVSTILKVDSHRIDQLINRVGELVVSSASFSQSASLTDDTNLQESAHIIGRLISEIREISLKLRMIQIGDTFQKYHRIVRDLSKELKKEISLQISGKETELDRTIVDKLGDPLTHLIRNACDHGLENPEIREAQGKNRIGLIQLNAFHDTGSVVIQIKDDGRGIDPIKIWNRALEKGFVSGSLPSSQDEIFKLLFEPGFSTAESITNVSGRGVGLDVVHRNIEALRGSIQVKSEVGSGSEFVVRLPLTLAIIDGFLVSVGDSLYVIPMDNVLECLEFRKQESDEENNYFLLRGNYIPFLSIRDFFEIQTENKSNRQNILIVAWGDKRAGLVVEELFGEFQTVIKPLGSVFNNIKGISGSSILADGRVALIIDLPTLFEKIIEKERILIN